MALFGKTEETKRKEIIIEVDDATRDIMQRQWMDYLQRQNVIKGLIDDHKFDEDADVLLESAVFKKYEKLCQESQVMWEAAGNEMLARYEPEEVKGKNYNWNLDFNKKELKFTLV